MLIQATERELRLLEYVSDEYKTEEMCERAVEGEL